MHGRVDMALVDHGQEPPPPPRREFVVQSMKMPCERGQGPGRPQEGHSSITLSCWSANTV